MSNGVALLDDVVRKYGVAKSFPPQVVRDFYRALSIE